MIEWVVFGLSIFNIILAIVSCNWTAALGWFCSSLGWLLIAMKK